MPAGTIVTSGSLVSPGGQQGIAGPNAVSSDAGNAATWGSDGRLYVAAVPTGTVLDFAGSTAPLGFLLCNGSAVSRTTYSNLYAVIGTTWGAGDGSTTFNVPDSRGRASIGAGQGTGLTNRALAAKGGEENHQLVIAELASHPHLMQDHYHGMDHYHLYDAVTNTGAGSQWGPTTAGSGTTTLGTRYGSAASSLFATTRAQSDTANSSSGVGNTGSAGSDTAHNTMMPFIVYNQIIKT